MLLRREMHYKDINKSNQIKLKVPKVKFGPFSTWRQFSQKPFDNFFSILSWSFPRRVLMDCQKMDLIESL